MGIGIWGICKGLGLAVSLRRGSLGLRSESKSLISRALEMCKLIAVLILLQARDWSDCLPEVD